jgi:hypothetical protein
MGKLDGICLLVMTMQEMILSPDGNKSSSSQSGILAKCKSKNITDYKSAQ